jgi:hypothetical protein
MSQAVAMSRLTLPQLALIVIRYRGLLIATLIAVIVTLGLNSTHQGVQVLVATRALPAGWPLSESDFATAYLDGADAELYVGQLDTVQSQTITTALAIGTPLMKHHLAQVNVAFDQVMVQIPLDAGNPGSFSVGSVVHVWSLTDELALLVSSNATVLETFSINGAAWVSLSIASVDENAVMQSGAVRLAVV